MGVFQDLEYPDNNERANRAAELTIDIKTAIYQLHSDKAEIDLLLDNAAKAIKKAYGSKTSPVSVFKAQTISSSTTAGDWIAYVSDTIIPILTARAASSAIDKLFVSMLVQEGRLGEAAFADLVGLPTWMKWGSRAGGAAVAMIVFAAVDAVISSVTGALQRSKLRGMINDLHPRRVEFEMAKLRTARIKSTLNAVEVAYDAIADTIDDQQLLDSIAKNIVQKHKLEIENITEDFVIKHLAALDNSRASWTNEDPSNSVASNMAIV